MDRSQCFVLRICWYEDVLLISWHKDVHSTKQCKIMAAFQWVRGDSLSLHGVAWYCLLWTLEMQPLSCIASCSEHLHANISATETIEINPLSCYFSLCPSIKESVHKSIYTNIEQQIDFNRAFFFRPSGASGAHQFRSMKRLLEI